MSEPEYFNTDHPDTFKIQALYWANSFDNACYFDSNAYPDPYSAFDVYIGAGCRDKLVNSASPGAFTRLDEFLKNQEFIIPGFFSYDLKNALEDLQSDNEDHLHFPDMHFFIPQTCVIVKGNQVSIFGPEPEISWKAINSITVPPEVPRPPTPVKTRFGEAEYRQTVNEIIRHIRRGDIYELNFCQEFYAENAQIDPLSVFLRLIRISPTPFSCFFKLEDLYIISATPERFLSRRGGKLISQPIKGTSARNEDKLKDDREKEKLQTSEKDRTENVMIVDLVRNDLTKSAKPGSVKVEELFGVYSFKQVHQMISTVVCEKAEGLSNAGIIANTFPMGSMTGAPKISAMKLAEKYEKTKRGVYSGAVGYFAPNGDFDFNVIIRTLLYNKSNRYLSFQTGGAITIDSDPEREYQECLLKARAIMEVLGHKKTR